MSKNPFSKLLKKEDESETKFAKYLNSTKSFLAKQYRKESTKSILSSIISIIIGLLIGLVVMIFISLFSKESSIASAFKGFGKIISGPFASSNPTYVINNLGDVIFYSVPLILTGLSVAVAYKTGLFNIGAPGQFIMGAVGSLLVALTIQTNTRLEGIMVWLLAVIVGTLCGMLWGVIPGLLKAFFNINEVIISIMTNWIAANLATWIFSSEFCKGIISQENTKGAYLMKNLSNYTPKLGFDKLFPGSYVDCGIFIAIIVAITIYIIMNKTTFGYELKACGMNKNASKYAGLNEKRNIVLSMGIAGALAGLAACLYYLNPGIEYKYASQYASLPAYGFSGIASAFLANCNPIGTVFSSLFIRYINMGGEYLTSVGFNRYVADIVIAVIIYLAGISRFVREILNKKNNKNNKINKEKEEQKTSIETEKVQTVTQESGGQING